MPDPGYFTKLRQFLTGSDQRSRNTSRRVRRQRCSSRSESAFHIESLEPRVLLAADLAAAVQAAQIVDPTVTEQAAAVSVVQTDPGSRANTSEVAPSNATSEAATSVGTVLGQFGTAPGRSKDLVLVDADGTRVRLNLEGSGVGEVRVDADGRWDVQLTGTNAQSIFTIETNKQGDGRVQIDDIHVVGPLGAIRAATTDLVGTLAIDGTVRSIQLGSADNAVIAAPTIQGEIHIVGTFNQSTILIGAQLGRDGQLGGTEEADADTFGQGTLGGLRIGDRVISDVQSPTLTAALANDTGNPDGVTRDPTISGTASDQSGIATLHAGFDGRPTVDISIKLQGGAFTLAPSDLAAINGGTLPDGTYTLTLLARDANGIGQVTKVTFTLDTTDPGLISWFPGDGNAEDVVGPHDGTLVNGAGFATGKVGQAFSFDGIDDEVALAHTSALNFGPTDSFTIAAWLKPSAPVPTVGEEAISLTYVCSPEVIALEVQPDGKTTFIIRDNNNILTLVESPNSIVDGQWHYVAGVRDVASDTVSLYVDGVLVASAQDATIGTFTRPDAGDRIGAAAAPCPVKYNYFGLIDEARIYNRALSPGEIQQLSTA